MAVLVEGISVIVRRTAIDEKMTGGWQRFRLLVPNSTLCEDGELVRVGFLAPPDVGKFIAELEDGDLQFMGEEGAVDFAVCDQLQGPTSECSWLEFTHLAIDGGKVGAAWLWEEERKGHGTHMRADMTIATPPGWHFKDSLSDKFEFVPNDAPADRRDH